MIRFVMVLKLFIRFLSQDSKEIHSKDSHDHITNRSNYILISLIEDVILCYSMKYLS